MDTGGPAVGVTEHDAYREAGLHSQLWTFACMIRLKAVDCLVPVVYLAALAWTATMWRDAPCAVHKLMPHDTWLLLLMLMLC